MKNFLFLLLFSSKISFACSCLPPDPISKEVTKKYDVIFYGKVDSVGICGTNGISTAYFTVNELYKGSIQQQTKVDFDCLSSCMMNFSKNEEWIIYGSFQRFNLITVGFCGHSKKLITDTSHYIFQIGKLTFEEEKEFLRTTLNIQPYATNNELNKKQNELGPHNDQPSGINKLLLLLISLIAMGIVYLFSKKRKKE